MSRRNVRIYAHKCIRMVQLINNIRFVWCQGITEYHALEELEVVESFSQIPSLGSRKFLQVEYILRLPPCASHNTVHVFNKDCAIKSREM
jgi:hypothetical protein